jgi:anti-sigma-K factor RskA
MAWDVRSLKQYVDRRFRDSERYLRLSQSTLESRLEAMNEFRGSMIDRERTFLPRAEYEARQGQFEEARRVIEDRLIQLQSRVDRMQGQESGTSDSSARWIAAMAALAAIAAVVVAVVLH